MPAVGTRPQSFSTTRPHFRGSHWLNAAATFIGALTYPCAPVGVCSTPICTMFVGLCNVIAASTAPALSVNTVLSTLANDIERRSHELLVQSFHLFDENLMVLKTQAIIEVVKGT